MNELHTTVKNIEATLQDARGELSVFENKFPTDSPEAQLIERLIEELDEASDPGTIEENVRDYSDDHDVTEETVFAPDIVDGDIILDFGNPVEVKRIDSWSTEPGYHEWEFTCAPYVGEEFTTTHGSGKVFRVALRAS